jgi:hypothetical protein
MAAKKPVEPQTESTASSPELSHPAAGANLAVCLTALRPGGKEALRKELERIIPQDQPNPQARAKPAFRHRKIMTNSYELLPNDEPEE